MRIYLTNCSSLLRSGILLGRSIGVEDDIGEFVIEICEIGILLDDGVVYWGGHLATTLLFSNWFILHGLSHFNSFVDIGSIYMTPSRAIHGVT